MRFSERQFFNAFYNNTQDYLISSWFITVQPVPICIVLIFNVYFKQMLQWRIKSAPKKSWKVQFWTFAAWKMNIVVLNKSKTTYCLSITSKLVTEFSFSCFIFSLLLVISSHALLVYKDHVSLKLFLLSKFFYMIFLPFLNWNRPTTSIFWSVHFKWETYVVWYMFEKIPLQM